MFAHFLFLKVEIFVASKWVSYQMKVGKYVYGWKHTMNESFFHHFSPKKMMYNKYDRYAVSWNLDDIFWKP
jgi:hypothetical protein